MHENESFDTGFVPPSREELGALLPGYDVEELIAQGGMGAVYRGVQTKLERLVAIKVLPAHFGADFGYADRFQLEAKAMARLSHSNIVGVYDYGETEGGRFLYFIMEFVEGSNLHELLLEGPPGVTEATSILKQVCSALQYAHENAIVHRDIKPANILIDSGGNVKMADFGLAKIRHGGEEAEEEVALGTPDYVAPECLVEGVEVDHRADIYSLGVLTYEMLTGSVPKGTYDLPSAACPGLDRRFDEIVVKALAADRDERFSSVAEIGRVLEEIEKTPRLVVAGGAAAAAAPAPALAGRPAAGKAPTRPVRPAKKSGNPAGLIVGVALLTIVVFAAIYFLKPPAKVDDPGPGGADAMAQTAPAPDGSSGSGEEPPDMPPGADDPPTPPPPPPPVVDTTPAPRLAPAFMVAQRRGGRLRGYGVGDGGHPVSVQHAAEFDDIIAVGARQGGNWIALRSNGDVISSIDTEMGLTDVVRLDALGPWKHFVKKDGTVWTGFREAQFPQEDLGDVIQACGGSGHNEALRADGSVVVWGKAYAEPVALGLPPAPLANIIDITATVGGTAAVDADGRVYCWARDGDVRTLENEDIVEVESGLYFFVAKTRAGRVIQWENTFPDRRMSVPEEVGKVVAIRAGGGAAAAQRADGSWIAWGRNGFGVVDKINAMGPALDIAFYTHTRDKDRGYVIWIEPAEGEPAAAELLGDRLVEVAGIYRGRYLKEAVAPRDEAVARLNAQYFSAMERSLAAVDPEGELAEKIRNEVGRVEKLIDEAAVQGIQAPAKLAGDRAPGWMPDEMRDNYATYHERLTGIAEARDAIGKELFEEYLASLEELQSEVVVSADETAIARINDVMEFVRKRGPAILR